MKFSKRLDKLTPFLVILVIWLGISLLGIIDPLFLSSPQQTFLKLFQLLFSGEIFLDIIATLLRLIVGFLFGSILGITIGLIIGYFSKVYDKLEFIIDFIRSTPTPVLFPLFLLFFGIGEFAKIMIITWASFLLLLINTSYGVRHSKKIRIIVAKLYKVNNLQLFYKVLLPEALPHIFAGIRVAISHSLVVVLFVEMFIGTYVGIGYKILNAQLLFKTAEMYALIILSSTIGYLLNKVIIIIENKILHWTKY